MIRQTNARIISIAAQADCPLRLFVVVFFVVVFCFCFFVFFFQSRQFNPFGFYIAHFKCLACWVIINSSVTLVIGFFRDVAHMFVFYM